MHAYVCMVFCITGRSLLSWKSLPLLKKPSTSSRKYSNLWWSGCKCMYIPQKCTPWHSKCRVSSKLTRLSQSCLYISFGDWEYAYISLLIEEVIELVWKAIMWDKEGLHQRKGEKGKEIFLQNKWEGNWKLSAGVVDTHIKIVTWKEWFSTCYALQPP